jgi:hypothetical protein
MAKLINITADVLPIQTTDKAACLAILQTIFSAIKTEHS